MIVIRKALIFKLMMIFTFNAIAIGLVGRNSLVNIIIFSLVLTAINYVIGDLLILPRLGNGIASIADGLFSALAVYIAEMIVPSFRFNNVGLIIFAILITIGEYFFHVYLFTSEEIRSETQ